VEVLNLKKDILLPAFPIPKEFQVHSDSNLNQWEYLRHITHEGAKKRYGDITPRYRNGWILNCSLLKPWALPVIS
jgi:DNA polymerase-3 subunit alpha